MRPGGDVGRAVMPTATGDINQAKNSGAVRVKANHSGNRRRCSYLYEKEKHFMTGRVVASDEAHPGQTGLFFWKSAPFPLDKMMVPRYN